MAKAYIKFEMVLVQDQDGTWAGYEDPEEFLWENPVRPDDCSIEIQED